MKTQNHQLNEVRQLQYRSWHPKLESIVALLILTWKFEHSEASSLQYQTIVNMPREIIISLNQSYPFCAYKGEAKPETSLLVRKIYEGDFEFQQKIYQMLAIRRKTTHKHLIKIQKVLDDQESIHVMFQYVPLKLERWMALVNEQLANTFKEQLYNLACYLASNHIKTSLHLSNIGMDHNNDIKYFLDLNYEFDSSLDTEELKTSYMGQIKTLFDSQILNSTNNSSLEATKAFRQSITPSQQFFMINAQKTKKLVSTNASVKDSSNLEDTLKVYSPVQQRRQKVQQSVHLDLDHSNLDFLQEFIDILGNEEGSAQQSSLEDIDRKYASGKVVFNFKDFSRKSLSHHFNETCNNPGSASRRISTIGPMKRNQQDTYICQPHAKIQIHFDCQASQRQSIDTVFRQTIICRPKDKVPYGKDAEIIFNQVKDLVQRSKVVMQKFKEKQMQI